ncbi:unnamed protein product [Cuscuta campestris]|uniref:Pentacotripeptide-repeat region of PRORP domain-containing protein n=1 Tax=Cuscuta campestris TaxID=132261 RepID=A0A484L1B4_9ASTE|nr:unnamed protein product [Cuscuta campestris]
MAASSRAFLSIASRRSATKSSSSRILSLASAEPSELQIDDDAVTAVCNSLRRRHTWETLSKELNSINLTSSLVRRVLLNLKDTSNATKALNFFHWSGKSARFNHGVLTYCITIHILAKARLVKDAKALLESVLTKPGNSDVFTVLDSLLESYESIDSVPFVFDLFVQVCSKLRLLDRAFDVCKCLDENGFLLSVVSYNTLLHVLQKSKNHRMVWDVYGHMIAKRVNPNQTTVETMVSALCKEGRLQWFVDLVGRIHGKRCGPGVVVNTRLIHGMIEDGRTEEGLVLLKRMLQKNMIVDTVSYSLVVFAKVKMGDLDSVWNTVDDAIVLAREMEKVDMKPLLETFNSLLKGCSNSGRVNESLGFCKKMVQIGYVPSPWAFNVMTEKLCKNGMAKEADQMLTVLLDKGFVPDENAYYHLLAGHAKEGDIEGALKLYYEMEYRSISPNSSCFTWLIIGLCKAGRLSEAEKFLCLMKARSLTPSSDLCKLLISCHLEKGDQSRADQLYREMI